MGFVGGYEFELTLLAASLSLVFLGAGPVTGEDGLRTSRRDADGRIPLMPSAGVPALDAQRFRNFLTLLAIPAGSRPCFA